MKQKNLILVAVAVGCGLVAAFLTSQMSAKPSVVTVSVPVAARDIPIGTKIEKGDLKKLVKMTKMNKELLPQTFIATEAELVDKWTKKSVRAGATFNPGDITNSLTISPPPGMSVMTISADATQAVAGFAGPGSHVDVIASVRVMGKRNSAVVFPLFTDMLVLAINTHLGPPERNAAYANLDKVSFAVTNNQALILHAAVNRGASLRLILRHQEKPGTWDKVPTEAEIWRILSQVPQIADGGDGMEEEPETPAAETVKLPVPVEDLPAGTQLTPELIEQKFKLMDWTPPAPANVTQNLKEHTGKFLTDKLAANQFVPLSFLGAKPVEVAPPPPRVVEVKPVPAPKPAPPKADPPVFFDSTVQTAAGFKKYRYQVLKSGEMKYLGEVREDGTLKPVEDKGGPPADAPKPDAPKSDDPKPADRVI